MNKFRRTERHWTLRDSFGPMLKKTGSFKDSHEVTRARILQKNLRDFWDGIADLYDSPDPKQTPTKNRQDLYTRAKKAMDGFFHRAESTIDDLEARAALVDRDYDEVLGINPDGKHNQEIRSALRTMEKEQRQSYLTKALEDGNPEIWSAILTAPAFLSGLTEHRKAGYKKTLLEKHCSELKDYQQALQEMSTALREAIGASERMVKDLAGSPLDRQIDEQLIRQRQMAEQKFEKALIDEDN